MGGVSNKRGQCRWHPKPPTLAQLRKEARARRATTRWATAAGFADLISALGSQGLADIEWAESLFLPTSAEQFAAETIYVICNSGMKNTIARQIYDRVMPCVRGGSSALDAFKHKGKALAIDEIWNHREFLFGKFRDLKPEFRLDFLASLPWIGPVTKYHLAKNFGVDCCKPDVHLMRLAKHAKTTPDGLCRALAAQTRYRIATVDTILWRACAMGYIDSNTGAMRDTPRHPTQHSREKGGHDGT